MSDLGNKEIMAKNIKRSMRINGVDRKKLSDDLGISYTTVSDWVNGKTYPRIDKIELLADYFKISKSQLVESDEPSDYSDNLDLEKMLDSAMTYSGKPLSETDKEIVKAFLEGKFGK